MAIGFKRLLGCLDFGVLHAITKRSQCRVCIGIDGKELAASSHATGGLDVEDALHGSVKHLGIGDADHLHIEEFAKGPAGIVVRRFLRIIGTPVLMVEQRVRHTRIGLIHTNDIAPGRELDNCWLGRCFVFLRILPRGVLLRGASISLIGSCLRRSLSAPTTGRLLFFRRHLRTERGRSAGDFTSLFAQDRQQRCL